MVKPRQYVRLEALSDNSAVQRDTILNFSGQSVAMRVARMQKSRGKKSISVHNGVKSIPGFYWIRNYQLIEFGTNKHC